MRILFISAWYPYPPDNGSKIRVYHLLQELARHHQITLLSFLPTAAETRFIPRLQEFCTTVRVVQRDPFQRDRMKAILGFLSPRPRSVVSTYSPEMAQSVRKTVRRESFDIVIASTTATAAYALQVSGVPKVLEEHNFMTRLMWEQYHAQRSPLKQLQRWLTWQKSKRYESWLFRQFDACTMVSEQDKAAVLATMPGCPRVEVIPNGVDVHYYAAGSIAPAPYTLVFNGALTYSANHDATRYFLGEILPLIRAEVPDVALKITGSTAGVDLDGLSLDSNVVLTGYMDDIRPVVAASWVCVVPLRVGGGTRLKILEAMALGTPVVTTSKGAEGLDVSPGQDILIADEPAEFATSTLRLLRDPALRQHLAHHGRKLVERKYSWTKIGQKLNSLLEIVVRERSSR